jgi:hypothetical protein
MAVLCVVAGRARCGPDELTPGDIVLIAAGSDLRVEPVGSVEVVQVTFPR